MRGGGEVGDGYYTRMFSALIKKTVSDKSKFNVSLIVTGKVTKTVPINLFTGQPIQFPG